MPFIDKALSTGKKNLLRACAAGIASNLEFLRREPGCLPEALKRQVVLDLKMLETGMVHSGIKAPDSLTSLVDRLVGNEVAALTYEDIVLNNTGTPMRTFTRGAVGKDEARFYRVHQVIEDSLGEVIDTVGAVRSSLERGQLYCDSEAILKVQAKCQEVLTLTEGLRDMPPEHFNQFRKFFNSHPLRGTKGPSGLFTAKIPTLEMLLRTESLDENHSKHVRENIKYLPRLERPALLEAQKGPSLAFLVEQKGSSPELDVLLETLSKFFYQFRLAHYRVVGKQVPEAVSDKTAGSGGEQHPGRFLRGRISESRAALVKK